MRDIELLLEALLNDGHEEVADAAAVALGSMRSADTVDAAIRALQSGRRTWKLAEVLGALGDRRAIEPLQRLLSGSFLDRSAAAEALNKLGEPRWMEIFGDFVGCWERLAKSGLQNALTLLLGALDQAGGTEKQKVVEALGYFTERPAIEALISALGDPEREIRQTAASALARAGAPDWGDRIGSESSATLTSFADDMRALALSGLPDAARALVTAAQHYYASDDATRLGWSVAVEALTQLGHPDAVEPLLGALTHTGSHCAEMRQTAARALAEFARHGKLPVSAWKRARELSMAPLVNERRREPGCVVSFHVDSGVGVDFPDPPTGCA